MKSRWQRWRVVLKTTTIRRRLRAFGDWHLLRALAIHRPELTAPYVHLIDQEPFDED